MSIPSNPFQSPQLPPQNDGGYYGAPPKEDTRIIPIWVWIVLGGLLGMGALACCGCGGLMWFGLNVQAEELKVSLKGNPVIEEHIGEITELSIDFGETIGHDGSETTVCRVKGTKGSGKIVGETTANELNNEVFRSGELILPDGTKHDLFQH